MLNFLGAIAAAVLNDKIGNDAIAGWISQAIKAVQAGRLLDENLKLLTAEIEAHVEAGTEPDNDDFDALRDRSNSAHDAIQNTDLGQGADPNPAAGAGSAPDPSPGGDGGSSGDGGSGAAEGDGENSNPGGAPPTPPE